MHTFCCPTHPATLQFTRESKLNPVRVDEALKASANGGAVDSYKARELWADEQMMLASAGMPWPHSGLLCPYAAALSKGPHYCRARG